MYTLEWPKKHEKNNFVPRKNNIKFQGNLVAKQLVDMLQ